MAIVLGSDWERDLWNSPYSLRFELSEGDTYINMFATAFDRARRLARAAITTELPIAVIASFPEPSRELGAEEFGWKDGAGFDHLKDIGVPTDSPLAEWLGYYWPGDVEDEEAEPWVHRAVKLSWDQADILLWNQIAQDLGVAPRAPVKSKLVDLRAELCVHAYDDRGMDITALTKKPLNALYIQFDEWLLDYDRPRMSEVFDG